MGLFDDIGHAFSNAGQTISSGVQSGGQTVGDGFIHFGNDVKNGGQTGWSAVSDWVDRENIRKQKEAAAYCNQKDAENEASRSASLAAARSSVQAKANEFEQSSNRLQQQLSQLTRRKDTLQQQWQTSSVAEYQKMVTALIVSLASFTRVAFVLRKHSVEAIRQAKLTNKIDPELTGAINYLMNALGFAKRALKVASSRSNDLLTTIQGVHADVRDLAEVKIPNLSTQITALSRTLPDAAADGAALGTIQKAIDVLQSQEKNTRSELFNHLNLSPGDHAAAIFTTPLREGKLYPDDWKVYADNMFRTISQYDQAINEKIATRDVLQAQLSGLDNLGRTLDPLRTSANTLYKQAGEALDMITNMNPQISGLQVSVTELANSFDQIADPVQGPKTSTTVSILAGNGAKAISIDYCMHSIGTMLLAQLQQVPIPAASTSAAGGAHRENASQPPTSSSGSVQQDWSAMQKSLALPPRDPFPEFAATPAFGEHNHRSDVVVGLEGELAEELQAIFTQGSWVVNSRTSMFPATLGALQTLEVNQ